MERASAYLLYHVETPLCLISKKFDRFTVFSDNLGNKLHASDYADFKTEFPNIPVDFHTTNGIMHDRYIVLDFDTGGERIFHCGASSKDAGKKMTSITEYTEADVKAAFHTVVKKLLANPALNLN